MQEKGSRELGREVREESCGKNTTRKQQDDEWTIIMEAETWESEQEEKEIWKHVRRTKLLQIN